jgi:hypothetical protein
LLQGLIENAIVSRCEFEHAHGMFQTSISSPLVLLLLVAFEEPMLDVATLGMVLLIVVVQGDSAMVPLVLASVEEGYHLRS